MTLERNTRDSAPSSPHNLPPSLSHSNPAFPSQKQIFVPRFTRRNATKKEMEGGGAYQSNIQTHKKKKSYLKVALTFRCERVEAEKQRCVTTTTSAFFFVLFFLFTKRLTETPELQSRSNSWEQKEKKRSKTKKKNEQTSIISLSLSFFQKNHFVLFLAISFELQVIKKNQTNDVSSLHFLFASTATSTVRLRPRALRAGRGGGWGVRQEAAWTCCVAPVCVCVCCFIVLFFRWCL